MATACRTPCHEQPGFRPCAACEVPMSTNALYSFVGRRVRCICTDCWLLGFTFDAAGMVVLGPKPMARTLEAA